VEKAREKIKKRRRRRRREREEGDILLLLSLFKNVKEMDITIKILVRCTQSTSTE